MNVFVAGIHGVGKTYLASRLPADLGLMHTSASKLIREERDQASWSVDKRVSNVDDNQVALAAAVQRHNAKGTALLLDGHFVLLNEQRQFVYLESKVFSTLNLAGVMLVEASPEVVAERLQSRDDVVTDIEFLRRFIASERTQAQLVCKELGLQLRVLNAPDEASFSAAVQELR